MECSVGSGCLVRGGALKTENHTLSIAIICDIHCRGWSQQLYRACLKRIISVYQVADVYYYDNISNLTRSKQI